MTLGLMGADEGGVAWTGAGDHAWRIVTAAGEVLLAKSHRQLSAGGKDLTVDLKPLRREIRKLRP
jgi:hypothetical protein